MLNDVERFRTRSELLILRARDAMRYCACGREALNLIANEIHKLGFDENLPQFETKVDYGPHLTIKSR